MRTLLLSLLIIFLISCDQKKLEKPSFLIGQWERINNKPNTKTFEVWGSDFKGMGYTLQGTDTIFKEFLSIVEQNNELVLFVEGVNEKPTPFAFNYLDGNSFICANPTNEFPKKIKYQWNGEVLTATISAGDQSIDFVFKKVK